MLLWTWNSPLGVWKWQAENLSPLILVADRVPLKGTQVSSQACVWAFKVLSCSKVQAGYPPALSLCVFFILPGVHPFMHVFRFTHAFIHASLHSPIHSCICLVSHPTFDERPWWVRHSLNLKIL